MSTTHTVPAQALDLLSPEAYCANRPHIYPSADSFRWFVRRHRADLVTCGALTCPTGRWLVQPEAFDRAIIDIGHKRATGAARG